MTVGEMANVTSTGGFTAPAATTPSTTTSKATVKTSAVTAGLPATATPAFKDDLAKATEKLQPVPHHGRTKIVGGERDGHYLNTSGNKRDGQAFTMEYHGGRRWHVYGEGADRVVVPFAKPVAKATDGGATATDGSGTKATTPAKAATPATPAVPAPSGQSPSYTTPAAGGAVPATDDGGTTGDETSARTARTVRHTTV
jgi:hypothetical protein